MRDAIETLLFHSWLWRIWRRWSAESSGTSSSGNEGEGEISDNLYFSLVLLLTRSFLVMPLFNFDPCLISLLFYNCLDLWNRCSFLSFFMYMLLLDSFFFSCCELGLVYSPGKMKILFLVYVPNLLILEIRLCICFIIIMPHDSLYFDFDSCS